MAGHSKWVNTKHRKASQDVKRGKIFNKIISELVTAARFGGSNLSTNSRLRVAVDKALSNNMTRNTLKRAITRGIGKNSSNDNLETIIYEGYGPGGIAIIVECFSNNRNRITSEVRHAFCQCGGNLGIHGSVSYLFKKTGIISFEKENEDAITEIALQLNVEDIIIHSTGRIYIYTSWEKTTSVYNAFKVYGLKPDKVKISMIPTTQIEINSEVELKLQRLIKILKEYNDVQNIYHNGKISNKECTDFYKS